MVGSSDFPTALYKDKDRKKEKKKRKKERKEEKERKKERKKKKGKKKGKKKKYRKERKKNERRTKGYMFNKITHKGYILIIFHCSFWRKHDHKVKRVISMSLSNSEKKKNKIFCSFMYIE